MPRRESFQQPPVGSLGPSAGCWGRSGLHTWPRPVPGQGENKERMERRHGPRQEGAPSLPSTGQARSCWPGSAHHRTSPLHPDHLPRHHLHHRETARASYAVPPPQPPRPRAPRPTSRHYSHLYPSRFKRADAATCAHDTTWGMFRPATPTRSSIKGLSQQHSGSAHPCMKLKASRHSWTSQHGGRPFCLLYVTSFSQSLVATRHLHFLQLQPSPLATALALLCPVRHPGPQPPALRLSTAPTGAATSSGRRSPSRHGPPSDSPEGARR